MDDRLKLAATLALVALLFACAGLLDNPDITMPWEDTADAYLF